MDNVFLEDWKMAQYNAIKPMFPHLTKDQIYQVLDEDITKNFQDRNTIIHNDYNDDMELKQPLTSIYRFAKEKKPILAGNGTFFYNQDKISSPIADLIDDRMDTRTFHKNKMKDTLVEMSKYEKGTKEYAILEDQYKHEDTAQMEAKIRINSIYGSFGAPTFQLYNKYTAASTTGTAQSLISATGMSFEAFVGDNVKFKSFGECIVFMSNIIHEQYQMPTKGIARITDRDIVYDRMVSNFDTGVFNEDTMGDILYEYISTLTSDELTMIYYKNNLYKFCENETIVNIISEAFDKIDSFNNPNGVPEEIQEDIELLWAYCREYVFYNHPYTERINRLKHDKRRSVKLIDTDSNLVHVHPWVSFIEEHVLPISHTSMTGDTFIFAAINTLTYMITEMLKDLLTKYCVDCNVLERYHKRINMKNEFCFSTLLLAATKKRYVAKIVLREGKPIVKTEIKGHDFKKAGVTEYVTDKMEHIIQTRILDADPVDLVGILKDLDTVEKEIYSSLRAGERKYLVRMNCKVEAAYKNPLSMGQVLSVLVWNYVCPNAEIEVPDKLDVVLLNVPNVEALEPIRTTFPNEYNRMKQLIENGPRDAGFDKKGIKYIALPNAIEKIPDWIIPLIDYDYVSSRNLGTFKPIREALGLTTIGTKDISYFSNVRYNTNITI